MRGKARRTERRGKQARTSPDEAIRRFSSTRSGLVSARSAYIVSTRFTRHVLSPLRSRLRSLRLYVYDRYRCPLRVSPSRDSSTRRPPPLTPGSTRVSPEVKARVLLLYLLIPYSLPFSCSANRPALSLNPRYPRADHLGNLSFCVDDISEILTELGSLMTSRAMWSTRVPRVEGVDLSRTSSPGALLSRFPCASRNP